MFRPNGGRQQLRRTLSRYYDESTSSGVGGTSSSSSSLPLPEPNTPSSTVRNSNSGTMPHQLHQNQEDNDHHHPLHPPPHHPMRNSFANDDMADDIESNTEFDTAPSADGAFPMYGHSNDSTDFHSINSNSGFPQTEELDSLAVENMMLREDFGRLAIFLQRNFPEVYTQFLAQSSATVLFESRSSSLPNASLNNQQSSAAGVNTVASVSLSASTTSLQAQLKRKEHDLTTLHHQRTQQEIELNSLRKQVKGLQDFIIQTRNKTQALEGIVDLDDVYFEREFKQLAAALKDWCWKLSRGVGLYVGCDEEGEANARKGEVKAGSSGDGDKPGWNFLTRLEIERLMKTHSKIGVITAFVMDRIWKGFLGRYAPGLSDEEDRVLRDLEHNMRSSGKIPMASINRWRASTISLLSKSPQTAETIALQTNNLVSSITSTLGALLVPSSSPTGTRPTPADERSLLKILEKATTLYTQLRSQRSRFELVFPAKSENYDCRMMEDSSDIVVYDEEDLMGGTVGAVAFPGVVKYGEEQEFERTKVADGGEEAGTGPSDGSPALGGGNPPGETTKPRVLVKVKVLCIVPEDPDE